MLLYPSRPVLDTPEPLSTNIRVGSKLGPQNDSSEKETRRKARVSIVVLLTGLSWSAQSSGDGLRPRHATPYS
jgi:hypothetical protein